MALILADASDTADWQAENKSAAEIVGAADPFDIMLTIQIVAGNQPSSESRNQAG